MDIDSNTLPPTLAADLARRVYELVDAESPLVENVQVLNGAVGNVMALEDKHLMTAFSGVGFVKARTVFGLPLPLTIRFGVLEFDGKDKQTLTESIDLIRHLKNDGLDMISVSINFNNPEAQIPWAPAFMGPIAERVRREVGIPVSSAWGFGEPHVAEKAVQDGQLDLVMVGRAHLANPHWAYYAARELKIDRASWTLPAP